MLMRYQPERPIRRPLLVWGDSIDGVFILVFTIIFLTLCSALMILVRFGPPPTDTISNQTIYDEYQLIRMERD